MKDDLKLIHALIQKQKGTSLLIGLAMVSSLISLMPMFFIGKAIDYISQGANISILIISFFLFSFFFFSSLSVLIRNALGYFSSSYISKLIFSLRKKIFHSLTTPSSYLSANISTSDKIYRTLNDTQNIDYVISQPLTTSAADIMDIIWVTVIMLFISPWLPLASWIVLPVLFYGSWKISKIQARLQNQRQVSEMRLLEKSKTSFDNLLRIIVFGGTNRERDKFLFEMDDNLKKNLNVNFNLSKVFTYEGIISAIGMLILVATSIFLFTFNMVTIGEVVFLISLSGRFFSPIRSIVRYLPIFQMGMVSMRRVGEFLEDYKEIEHKANDDVETYISKISVHEPSFSYDNNYKIKLNLTFTLEGGKVVFIKGKNGTGKSTLLKAIQGVGQSKVQGISYDGRDSHEVTLTKKLNSIIYFSSQFQLVEDKLSDEINYPHVLSNNDKEPLFAFEKMYSNYNKGGLSDGERLKILLSNLNNNIRRFVLLDEPFINLDEKSKHILHQRIAELKSEGISFIIISHEFNSLSDNYIDEFYQLSFN